MSLSRSSPGTRRRRLPRVMVLAGLAALAILPGACGSRDSQPRFSQDREPLNLREPTSDSRLRVAQAAESSGQTDVALSMYASAAAAEPGRPELQAAFAGALARAGNIGEAEEVLNRALQRSPNDQTLLLAVGRVRLRTGAAEEALAQFERVLQRSPRFAPALDGRGVALDLLGRHAEAQASYRAALVESPSSVSVANNLALSLLLDGKADEARAMLEPLARRGTAPSRIRANLAVARAATGDAAGARQLLGEQANNVDLGAITAEIGGPGAIAGLAPVAEASAARPR